MAQAFPPPEVWKREFPKEYTETPDGKWNVAYRNQGLTTLENERNSRKVQALIGEWQSKAGEVSGQRDAAVPTVRVRGMDGVVMHIPARMEAQGAKKGTIRPVKSYGRATRYWQDRAGRWWKRAPRGEWVACDGGR